MVAETLATAHPLCSRRLLARTLPFQGGKDGSKPFGSTKQGQPLTRPDPKLQRT